MVCQLKQAIYSLKQALQVWYSVIEEFLKEKRFTTIEFNQSVFISANKQLISAIYVDDLLLFGANKANINVFKKELSFCFEMTDPRDVSYYFEIKIRYDQERSTLRFLQTTYLKVVLEWFDMAKCNPSTTLMDSGFSNTIMLSFPDYQAALKTIL